MSIRVISPSKCKIWTMHDRLGDEIDTISCGSLISSIESHGQKHPALGRPIADHEGFEIELIYGARRLFAAQHLGIDLLVDVREVDDLAALVEMDIENRVRTDISPYERGLCYKRWLRARYFNTQADLAKALGVSEAQISRLLRYSDLPSVVLSAFDSPHDIKETWAVALAKRCNGGEERQNLLRRARALKAAGNRPRSPDAVFNRLTNGAQKAVPLESHDEVVRSRHGNPLFRVRFGQSSVQLVLPRKVLDKIVLAKITEQVRELLEPETNRSTEHNFATAQIGDRI